MLKIAQKNITNTIRALSSLSSLSRAEFMPIPCREGSHQEFSLPSEAFRPARDRNIAQALQARDAP